MSRLRSIFWPVVLSYAHSEISASVVLRCVQISGDEAVKKLRDSGVKAAIDVIQLDVTNDDHIEAAVSFVEKKYGKLDGESMASFHILF